MSGALDPSWPSDGSALCTISGEQYSPSLVVDGEGKVVVSWTGFRPGVYSDIYAQRVDAGGAVAAVGDGPDACFRLHPIRPNPARAAAVVRLSLPAPRRITVEVLDMAGRRVCTLLAGRELAAGVHEIVWTRVDDAGAQQRNGVYWVRAMAPEGSSAQKVLLLLR